MICLAQTYFKNWQLFIELCSVYKSVKDIIAKGRDIFGMKGVSPYFCTPKKTFDLVAQLVEHITFNDGALGSSPSGITGSKGHLFKSPQI